MTLRDLWRRIVFEALVAEFGREVASVLASLPIAVRRSKIRDWYSARPVSPALSPPVDPWEAARRKLDALSHIIREHRNSLSSAVFTAIERDAVQLEELLAEPPDTEYSKAASLLYHAECVLFFLATETQVSGRRLSIEGEEQFRVLRLQATKCMTQKSRVQLMLEDFERYHGQVLERDRPNVERWLGKLRDLHRSYEGVVDRVREVLRAEEKLVRDGYACDPKALDVFRDEVAGYERELRGFRLAGRVPWRA